MTQTVVAIMIPNPITVTPQRLSKEAIKLLAEKYISELSVINDLIKLL
jgi:CBS domain-containing protein